MDVISRGRLKRSRESNASTAGQWTSYASHREQLGLLIRAEELRHARGGLTVTILGAGNCNDVDLHGLIAKDFRVNLVDIDAEALGFALGQQRVDASKVKLFGGVDLQRQPDLLSLHNSAEIVLSAAVLSQLLGEIKPERSQAEAVDAIRQLRRQHLLTMLQLAAPGGRILLVNDLIASQTVPDLERTTGRRLSSLAGALIAEGNFFTGTNPWTICDQLRTDAALSEAVDVQLEAFWIWKMSDAVARLTYAIGFRRGIPDAQPS